MRALSLLLSVALGACSGPAADDAGVPPDAAAVDGSQAFDAGPSPSDAGPSTGDAGRMDGGMARPDAGPDGGTADAGTPAPTLEDRLEALSDPSARPEDLDALIHEVAWSEGWPVSDGRRWLFATRWDDAPGTVSLVSDVNGWTPDEATRTASPAHFFVVLDAAAFEASPEGAKYKWHGAPDVFRAPPEATAYGYDSFGEFGYVAPPTAERYRERFPAFGSRFLERTRAFRAYLPAGFSPGSPARVLLLHDGQNVFDPGAFFGGWRVDESISAAGLEDVVVLAIDNAPDRFDAYTHVADDIGRGGRVGGRAADYARLVFDEALPFFRSHYGLRASSSDLVVGGSSLGGLVSLYLAMSHASEMRCVIAMSSTLGWGAFDEAASGADALTRRWTSHDSVAIYLDSGGDGTCADTDGDGVVEDSDDSDNYCTTLQLRDHLVGLGFTLEADLFYQWERGAGHNELAWARRMPAALQACVSAGWLP